jgi:hypothetical protein
MRFGDDPSVQKLPNPKLYCGTWASVAALLHASDRYLAGAPDSCKRSRVGGAKRSSGFPEPTALFSQLRYRANSIRSAIVALKSHNRPQRERLPRFKARISVVKKIKLAVVTGACEWLGFSES